MSRKKNKKRSKKFLDKIKDLKTVTYDKETYHIIRDEMFIDFFKSISKNKLSMSEIKSLSNNFVKLPNDVWYS